MSSAETWTDLPACAGDFPPALALPGGNDRIVLVQHLAATDPAIAAEDGAHSRRIRETLLYPGGEEVTADGLAVRDGRLTVRLPKVSPPSDLCLFRRFDAGRGPQRCLVLANRLRVGTWRFDKLDGRTRWRNHYFLVPAALLSRDSDTDLFLEPEPDSELALFDLWIYRVEYKSN